MRIRTLACLSLVAGACAVAATGFPRRIGLTASQADVSLPGDLILPGANVVVDRGIAIDAPASVVWDVLGHAFEPADESTIIEIADEDHVLMRVAAPGAPEGAPASGTCVIALLPLSPSRTLLHIRERHEASGRELALVWAGVSAESLSSLSMLRDLREACMAHAEHA
jgi:hypothetical protein